MAQVCELHNVPSLLIAELPVISIHVQLEVLILASSCRYALEVEHVCTQSDRPSIFHCTQFHLESVALLFLDVLQINLNVNSF